PRRPRRRPRPRPSSGLPSSHATTPASGPRRQGSPPRRAAAAGSTTPPPVCWKPSPDRTASRSDDSGKGPVVAELHFPVHYRPRPYQAALHAMWKRKRYGVAVLSRQAGKDVAMSMEMVERRLRIPKTTGAYISLDNPMIRDILWDKTYSDEETGEYLHLLQDNVPGELVDWKNTVMEGRFSNGSRLKFQGYFQSGKDKNGVGTSFQDYAFTELALFYKEDPIPRLMPILTSTNDKRLMVVSTPRGKRKNPLYQLMQSLQGDPEYGEIVWGIDNINAQMRAAGLPPVRTEAQLEKDKDAYLKRFGNDRMFNQEY